MISTTEEFERAFHSLNEASIGARRKQLFFLFRQTNSTAIDFSAIKARTPLEEKFMIEAFIFFGKWLELVNLLKCENPVVLEKIVNVKDCLQMISSLSNEDLLLLLSNISYNAKLKILNKLPLYLDRSKANDVFNAVLNGYGFYLASKVLPACTIEFVIKYLKDVRWKPSAQQLMQILGKHPDAHAEVLTYLSGKKLKDCHKVVVSYVAKKNPKLFLEIYKNDESCTSLGRRVTRKFVKTNKADIIHSPDLYYKFLHKKQLVKSIGDGFPNMYSNMFTNDIDKFRLCYNRLYEVLQNLPAKRRNFNLLLDAFHRRYCKSFWDYPEYVTHDILKMLPTEQREQVLKPEFKGDMSEDRWMCYFSTDKAIPFLKKRVSVSSDIKTRADLIELLVETCKINQDKVALTSVCRYMNTQHRNDHVSVRLAFLRGIQKSFGFALLDETHWTPINELIKLFTLNDEHFFYHEEFLEAHIRFCLNQNLPIREQLRELVKSRSVTFNILKDTPAYEKRCLVEFGEIVLEVFSSEEDLQMFSIYFLNALVSWNKRHRKDQFLLEKYSKAMEYMKKNLEKENSCFFYTNNIVIKFCLKGNAAEDLVSLYLAPNNKYPDLEVFLLVFRKYPHFISNNIDVVLKTFLQSCGRNKIFWMVCCNYSHLEIPQKMVEYCLKEVDASPEDTLRLCMEGLSMMMLPNDFIEFIKRQRKERDGDVTQEQYLKNLKIQKIVGGFLKNVQLNPSILNSVLTLCEGNSYKYFHSSLSSILNRVNEDHLFTITGEVNARSVFVRKHIVLFALQSFSKPRVSTILKSLIDVEKNQSIRKCIFRISFRLFTQNPGSESFDLFKTLADAIEFRDSKTLNVLVMTQKVSLDCFLPYALLSWDLLLNKASSEEKQKYMETFLKSLSLNQIRLLPDSFCSSIFEFLFKGDLNLIQKSVQAFVCRFLVVTQDDLHLETICDKLKQWVSDGGLQKHRSSLTNFVTEYCSLFLDSSCTDKVVFAKFMSMWNSVFKPHDAFDEFLHLHFTLVYLEKPDLSELALKLSDLCQILTADYGLAFVKLYFDKLKVFMDYLFKVNGGDLEENLYVVIENVVKSERRILPCLLLVILIFNEHLPTFDATKKKYSSALSILQDQTDPIVQIFLNNHFRNTVTS